MANRTSLIAIFLALTIVPVGFGLFNQAEAQSQHALRSQATALTSSFQNDQNIALQEQQRQLNATALANTIQQATQYAQHLDQTQRQVANNVWATQIALRVQEQAQQGNLRATVSTRAQQQQSTQIAAEQVAQQTQIAVSVQQTVRAIPTATPLPTATPVPTATPGKPKLNAWVLGCTTGFDAPLRRIGETTIAYVYIENVGEVEADNVQITLSASDEEGDHPDKHMMVQFLPPGHAVSLDLTTGTKYLQQTSINVRINPEGGPQEDVQRADCSEIDAKSADSLIQMLRLVRPIDDFSFLLEKIRP